MNERRVIRLDNPDPETARILALADTHPVRVELDGVIYRIERDDHYRYYHPEEDEDEGDGGGRSCASSVSVSALLAGARTLRSKEVYLAL
jgi:hypothetical protein